jgi:uncharacterized protein YPO0396
MLFIGPSGSGKSTLLDAHASLLTPPRWLNFNVAARESEQKAGRLVYLRCLPQQHDDVRLDTRSVAAKVLVADGPFQRWVQDELRSRFDVICVPTAAELREYPAAVTRAGQIQRGRRLHEKDDSHRINDPRRWVLGANTEAKSHRLLDSLAALNEQLAKARERLLAFEAAERLARERIVYGQSIVGLAWPDIDVEASVLEVAGLDRMIDDLLKDATVAELQTRVGEAELALGNAQESLGAQETQVARTVFQLEGLSSRLKKLEEFSTVDCTPTQVSGIETALELLRKEPTLETYADDMRAVERHLEQKRSDAGKDRDLRVRDIVEAFRDFIRQWPTDADVRLHVEFVARELEVGTDREIEVYRSGGGKSGGQRQKLTATCLAAALRYQLGGPERIRSSFATVILDEAFDKADADFTEAAIRVFKMFGFQLIIATPVKSVMTIEPFVGGAVYIHIQGGRKSNLMQLPYDEVAQRIDLDAAGVETSSDGAT